MRPKEDFSPAGEMVRSYGEISIPPAEISATTATYERDLDFDSKITTRRDHK